MSQNITQMKLFSPDACWRPDMISGALFLYFHREKVMLPLHPSVSTHLTGADPAEFFRFAETRAPSWQPKLSRFGQILTQYRGSLIQTSRTLEPLRDCGFKLLMLSYPRNEQAWEAAEDLIASSDLPFDDIATLIDPYSAADELYSHIFFETFLELYGSKQSDEGEPRQIDWQALYEYVDKLFSSKELKVLLTTTYMFRVPILNAIPAVLLSNPNMVEFLSSLPVKVKRSNDNEKMSIDLDVVGWEFFRQLLSPKTDPLDDNSVAEVRKIVETRPAEIDALIHKCLALAQELSGETNLTTLQNTVGQHIRANVEGEIQSLLFMDKAAVNDFLDLVFADYKVWAGIGTFLYSWTAGGSLLTAGGAIAALATVGSSAMKAVAERRKKLETSDYALLYRMRATRS